MDGQKPIHHFPTLVYTEAVFTFFGKDDVVCYVIERKVMAFFYKKKRPNKMYGAKLIF